MYFLRNASKARIKEAEQARQNRRDIVKALSHGQISKRDLIKWGILTTAGTMVVKNGLSPFARSAFAAVPTGTPPSPVPPGLKFTQPLPRLNLQTPLPLLGRDYMETATGTGGVSVKETEFAFCTPGSTSAIAGQPGARRSSYHSNFNAGGYYVDQSGRQCSAANPISGLGPMEGRPGLRPDGDYFAHQRWNEVPPKVGYLMSLGQIRPGSTFHPGLPAQDANNVWSFGSRYNTSWTSSTGADLSKPAGYYGHQTGSLTAPLMRVRYNEPAITRIYNDLPVDRELNGGFGRNEISTHYHNAHNGAESDGACNAYHFPGTFYDYHWSSVLARRDWRSYPQRMDAAFKPGDPRASTPDGKGGLEPVEGDFREIQGTMWFHDHRFFFTAENVHKGNFGMVNMYSGPDRGNEGLEDGVNLRLPSGTAEDWGNLDYDINLTVSNPALDQKAQLYFDIFDTDGFLGDILAVNGSYYPYMDVKARRYRFRILNASMSRFIKLAVVDQDGKAVPFHFVANDGNFVNRAIPILDGTLDEQGVAERYDIVVDFKIAKARGVRRMYLVNVLQQTNGRKPDGAVSVGSAMRGISADPAVGKILEFRVGDLAPDMSADFWGKDAAKPLTEQVPIQPAVRTRTIEFVRSQGDSRKTADGQCIPDCGTTENFPWSIKINGQAAHSLNASRISALIPQPGEVEQWTLVNGGGGWDHPIHLHFEEGITLNRGGAFLPDTEKLVRKDVWRLRPSGSVTFQVRFGEFGGAYVNHCHNTVHEDFAMLLRYQLLRGADSTDPQRFVTPTPIPTEGGVRWKDSEILPEGDPRAQQAAATKGKA